MASEQGLQTRCGITFSCPAGIGDMDLLMVKLLNERMEVARSHFVGRFLAPPRSLACSTHYSNEKSGNRQMRNRLSSCWSANAFRGLTICDITRRESETLYATHDIGRRLASDPVHAADGEPSRLATTVAGDDQQERL